MTERFDYSYAYTTGNDELTSVTVARRTGEGSWENIQRATYTYYGFDEIHGGYGDLRTVMTEQWDGSSWESTGTTYYRYYLQIGGTSSSSSSSSSGSALMTPVHLVKYVVNPESYAQLEDDPAVTNPLTAPDETVALYADFYYDYDAAERVRTESLKGGSATYTFTYEDSTFENGYNNWKRKTTETQPDGGQFVVYSNYAEQPMLSVFRSGTDEWLSFARYDGNGHRILEASPSAISGYDDQYADLLHEVDGLYEYLKSNDGLIQTYAYHSPSGYPAAERVQQGQLGTPITLREFTYVSCCSESSGSSSSSSSSSSGCGTAVWLRAKETVYPSETNQTQKIQTTYAYTFYDNTCQRKQKTTTLPVVSTAQNGSGTAATRKEYFDEYGYLTWQMDERGFITRTKYDIPTGAITQQIQDVDTSVETDAPTGWATPSGGGLNLVTDFEHDDRGRITQSLGPSHSIDLDGTATTIRRATWIVYDSSSTGKETRVGNGYATGSSPSYSYTLTNPVSITKTDLAGRTTEQIQATRASTSGKLVPSDTFTQSSYVRWTTTQYTDCCYVASQRVYHTIPSSGAGTEGTNYDETDYGYDSMKRRIRTVTPGGTITFNVLDARGLVEKVYVGTDDTGATPTDPTGGGASGNNMVLISSDEYDRGTDGGDGNLTTVTQQVDATTARITNLCYDFRNRRTATDGEIDYYEVVTYDNLSRVTRTEQYNTIGPCPGSSSSSSSSSSGSVIGNLIARSETMYDDRGRVYQTVRYAVDPVTGAVGNSLTDSTWYDAAGNAIKQLPAGSDLFTKTDYDSLSRTTARYSGYDLDETGYPG